MNKALSSLKSNFLLMMLIVVGFSAVYGLSVFLSSRKPPVPESYSDEDLALKGAKLKGFSLGFEGLLADWYWMQALQYIGDKIIKNADQPLNLDNLNSLNPRLLYPYLDNATTLDPQFTAAYYYGAMILPTIDKQQAIKILEKGIANNPDDWQMYHYLGYIYWKIGEYEKASETYSAGAKLKDAPPWMQLMSARISIDGSSRETSRLLYRQMLEGATDDNTRTSIELRLLQLDYLDETDVIRAALQNFQTKNGRCANDWREMFPLLKSQKSLNGSPLRFTSAELAPVDPTEVPYILNRDPGKCDVHLNYADSKIPYN